LLSNVNSDILSRPLTRGKLDQSESPAIDQRLNPAEKD